MSSVPSLSARLTLSVLVLSGFAAVHAASVAVVVTTVARPRLRISGEFSSTPPTPNRWSIPRFFRRLPSDSTSGTWATWYGPIAASRASGESDARKAIELNFMPVSSR